LYRHDVKVGQFLVAVPSQLAAVFELQLPQPEGNTTGGLRRRAIADLQGSPFLCCFLSSYFLSSLRFTVSFSQKCGFPLKAGGYPAILAAKTWQYLLKYGCGVRFACCYYRLHDFLCDHFRSLELHHDFIRLLFLQSHRVMIVALVPWPEKSEESDEF